MGFAYTPSAELRDYSVWDMATSSAITGDFTTDSLKYGFGPTSLSAESSDEAKLREYERTYGKEQAKIRMRLKKSIMKRETHGTKAGQWSARKSQLLKEEYEAACERAGLKPYKGSKTESQQNLSDWSDQDWRTASGGNSSQTGEPYFPAKAVAALKKKGLYAKAKRQKAAATKAGKQHADYSEDIEAVVRPFRAESPLDKEPWVSGERPDADLDYEIVAGYHTNPWGELGCPLCNNLDHYWRTETSKGRSYRCNYCDASESYVSVKSSGDITLEKFGLKFECPVCDQDISAFNREAILSHIKKHEKVVQDSESEDEPSIENCALIVGELTDSEQLDIELFGIDDVYELNTLSEIPTSVQEFAVNAAAEMMDDYPDIFPAVAIVFITDVFSQDHVARYRSQTVGNCPIVMLSLRAIQDSALEYDVPIDVAVATSVWHELGHALDEYFLEYHDLDVVGDDDPEDFAEQFALWYSGYGFSAPPTQEELFELSEE